MSVYNFVRSWPNFTRFFWFNVETTIFVNAIWISSLSSVDRNRAKFCMFLASKKFCGGNSPKILDRHYKTEPSTNHHAKFHAGRPTYFRDLTLTKKTRNFGQSLTWVRPATNVRVGEIWGGVNFVGVNVSWFELKCFGIRRTRIPT